ncbi:hypothetical protein [Paenarthrobacter sp. YIM B13468]|uniref:hypothetical protein n=1 Tax=Paenarthrobacter sp. YIM B13468 TaxID=3366295 RepID=UPI003671CF80
MNILVMGKAKSPDSDLDTEDTAATDLRRDTLMLAHIPADRKNVFVIYIMRDP